MSKHKKTLQIDETPRGEGSSQNKKPLVPKSSEAAGPSKKSKKWPAFTPEDTKLIDDKLKEVKTD